jgi:hypothetical protein
MCMTSSSASCHMLLPVSTLLTTSARHSITLAALGILVASCVVVALLYPTGPNPPNSSAHSTPIDTQQHGRQQPLNAMHTIQMPSQLVAAASQVPYVSFVIAARNDGYGLDDFRLQRAIVMLGHFSDKFQLDAELVLVDYNPPSDRPRLQDAYYFNTGLRRVRIITVPSELHQPANMPSCVAVGMSNTKAAYFEYHGKNVGIKRAAGKFVVAMNMDILVGAELMRFLAQRLLDHNAMYRVARRDLGPARVPVSFNAELIHSKALEV